MINLPTVTLICADCVHVEDSVKVLDRCMTGCTFGDVKLLSSQQTASPYLHKIAPLKSLVEYSVFMLKRIHEYVDTEHMLVVQHDGWIINPSSWNPDWLNYSFIGPLFIHNHNIDDRSVGTGGFSLRSRKLMEAVSKMVPDWDHTEECTARVQNHLGCYEDGAISMMYRQRLENLGFKYAPPMEAVKFSQGGNTDKNYWVERPFGFHGLWPNINRETGLVSPFDHRE
jgi:hypothetical protein